MNQTLSFMNFREGSMISGKGVRNHKGGSICEFYNIFSIFSKILAQKLNSLVSGGLQLNFS